jgi:hypothetical protein
MTSHPVYINGRVLAQRVTGVQRYARETLRELDGLLAARREDITLLILVPRGPLAPLLGALARGPPVAVPVAP